jgi:hypothetical protein
MEEWRGFACIVWSWTVIAFCHAIAVVGRVGGGKRDGWFCALVYQFC